MKTLLVDEQIINVSKKSSSGSIFLDYQKGILDLLKYLKRKKVIKIPKNLKNIIVELPPKNQKADMSCNAAMALAKINNSSPLEIAKVLKK